MPVWQPNQTIYFILESLHSNCHTVHLRMSHCPTTVVLAKPWRCDVPQEALVHRIWVPLAPPEGLIFALGSGRGLETGAAKDFSILKAKTDSHRLSIRAIAESY